MTNEGITLMKTSLFDLSGKVAIVTGGNGGIGLGMARGLADAGAGIFKVVTRADTTDDLITLLRILRLQSSPIRLCVMATGKFGAISRLLFPECGSVLVYAPLNRAFHDGQVTLEQLRGLRHFYGKR